MRRNTPPLFGSNPKFKTRASAIEYYSIRIAAILPSSSSSLKRQKSFPEGTSGRGEPMTTTGIPLRTALHWHHQGQGMIGGENHSGNAPINCLTQEGRSVSGYRCCLLAHSSKRRIQSSWSHQAKQDAPVPKIISRCLGNEGNRGLRRASATQTCCQQAGYDNQRRFLRYPIQHGTMLTLFIHGYGIDCGQTRPGESAAQ